MKLIIQFPISQTNTIMLLAKEDLTKDDVKKLIKVLETYEGK